jgi:phosphopantetheinyl transferase
MRLRSQINTNPSIGFEGIQTIEFEDCPASTYLVRRDFSAQMLERWCSWLGQDECARAKNYRFDHDRELFIARRGLARECLGTRVNCDPQSIRLDTTETGKLVWKAESEDCFCTNSRMHTPDFSVSSSGEVVVAAVAGRIHRVGVDVEMIREMPEIEMMAKQNLHESEYARWRTLSRDDQLLCYLKLWVIKESFAKALGCGFVIPPNQFSALDVFEEMNNSVVLYRRSPTQTIVGLYWTAEIAPKHFLGTVVL